MKQTLCLLILIGCAVMTLEGGETGKGIRSGGLARADVILPGDPWAVVHNPAVLSVKPFTGAAIFVRPSLFDLGELKTMALCGSFGCAGGTFSACIEQFGFDLYREFAGTAGFGSSVAPGLSCGGALEWRQTVIRGYGKSNALIVNAGCVAELAQGLHLGFVGNNILGETIGIDHQRFPQTSTMGISYNPVSSILIVVEAEKDLRYPPSMKAGLEIQVFESLVLRAGVEHDPDIVAAGFSIFSGATEFGYAGSVHALLGWTHQFELSVRMDR